MLKVKSNDCVIKMQNKFFILSRNFVFFISVFLILPSFDNIKADQVKDHSPNATYLNQINKDGFYILGPGDSIQIEVNELEKTILGYNKSRI